ncbi:MAG: UDP-N-acetylmuramoyl-L-alanyl-D-glutamate--2,6-diaminopimelate ligase [Gemmatimonadaceae bacterium]|nr:UDP-N-acetylmuramoyl-L-alanyl-D-glutamate--2,6-diaminopimelate ligase [Gemmatimonadaceae bacterium]
MSRLVPLETIRAALERAGQLLSVQGTLPDGVLAITDDSRKIGQRTCFVAVRGSERDGHAYLADVATAGAVCAIVEDASAASLPALVVRESRAASAIAAAAFYGEPAKAMRFVGVTGTNGKTTTVGIVRHLLDSAESPAASIGTLGVLIGSEGAMLPGGSGLTTPGPIELQRGLFELRQHGVGTVAMEVSSHALHQQRVLGVRFDAAVFTNLTRDHLDYHKTMDAYLEAKALLVGLLTEQGTAVVNAEDPAWDALPKAPRRVRFAADATAGAAPPGAAPVDADVRARDVRFTPRGSEWTLETLGGSAAVRLPLIGDFNVSNALGAAGAALALGVPVADVAARLATLPQVPGRLEVLHEHPTVLRDYAHTPDALERACLALRPFTPGRLIVLFGCGGDRDKGKRPLMALAALKYGDRIVVTSDNPRTEDPNAILDDIVAPLPHGSYVRIEDRRAAIAHAIALADPAQDVVVLAGKGHETYQIRGTTSFPFDEKAIVHDILKQSASRAEPA